MKRVLITLAILSLSAVAFGQTPGVSQLIGTGHDLSAITGENTGEICVYCHTPHYRETGTQQYPLWNHTLSSGQTYGTYTSTTMNAAPGDPGTGTLGTANYTQLCLSCHDGTVALGSLYNQPNSGSSTLGVMSTSANGYFGTDLSNDHPINFAYTTAIAGEDGQLFDPASNAATAALLEGGIGGTVQCTSCHDPHNYTAGQQPFLVMSNQDSALCATCHIK